MSNAWPHVPEEDDVKFAPNQKLPPGYRVVYDDDGVYTMFLAPDGVSCGGDHWNRWVSWRGAWQHYRRQQRAVS